jgi:hypothetical protein
MDFDNEEYIAQMRKQYEAMGIDPDTMMEYIKNAMKLQQDAMKLAQDQLADNPVLQNMMDAVQDGANDPLGLLDDSPELKEDSDLKKEELKAVACGANLAYLNCEYLNTLKTYLPEGQILALLERDWGINTREDLLETLKWLKKSGHRKRFKLIWKKLKEVPRAEWLSAIESIKFQLLSEDENAENLQEYAINIANGYSQMHGAGCFQTMKAPNIMTWDMGRAINLCRWAFDVGFLSKKEAKEHIMKYAEKCYEKYDSWASLGEGYIMGVAMWCGDEERVQTMIDEQKVLLEHENSLWTKIKW